MSDPNSDGCENSILAVRRQRFLYNRPSIRLSMVSPYTNYVAPSGDDEPLSVKLARRRKVEILKYNKNSNQSSKQTRAERFASLNRANPVVAKRIEQTLSCPNDSSNPTPLSRSDVPRVQGQTIFLYEEPGIPLYNYVLNRNVAAIQNTEKKEEIEYNIFENIECITGSDINTPAINKNIGSFSVTDIISQRLSDLSITIPIRLEISGSDLVTRDMSGVEITLNVLTDAETIANAANLKYVGAEPQNVTSNIIMSISTIKIRLTPETSIKFNYSGFVNTFMTLNFQNVITESEYTYGIHFRYQTSLTLSTILTIDEDESSHTPSFKIISNYTTTPTENINCVVLS